MPAKIFRTMVSFKAKNATDQWRVVGYLVVYMRIETFLYFNLISSAWLPLLVLLACPAMLPRRVVYLVCPWLARLLAPPSSCL